MSDTFDWAAIEKSINDSVRHDIRNACAGVYTEIAHKFSGTIEKAQQYHEVINYCLEEAEKLRRNL